MRIGTAAATAAEINDLGGNAVADSHSVSEPESAQAIINTAVDTWGRVAILVNNAGFVGDAAFEDMTPQRFEPLIDVHLRGAFLVSLTSVESHEALHRQAGPGARRPGRSVTRAPRLPGLRRDVLRRRRTGGAVLHRSQQGYFNPSLTPEDVRSHLAEIGDEGDYTVPSGPADEMAELLKVMFA